MSGRYAVILAGGSGTRFWPLSRRSLPKQLMSVFGGESMLQRTVRRILPLNLDGILVVTNALQREETLRQLAPFGDAPIQVVAEPAARNTAPAVAFAALLLEQRDPGSVSFVLPADHYITDEPEFRRTLQGAEREARSGRLVTLGIVATRPETGYGYIEAGVPRGEGRDVVRFVEKPDLQRALQFLEEGNFYWNSGMFTWRSDVILAEVRRHERELGMVLDQVQGLPGESQIAAFYAAAPAISIDYAVMEKSALVSVIPASFGWSDVGSWNAFPDVLPGDVQGNVAISAQPFLAVEAEGCLAYGGGGAVALVGVKDLVVVKTADAVMVCDRSRAQDVRKVVDELERRGMTELL